MHDDIATYYNITNRPERYNYNWLIHFHDKCNARSQPEYCNCTETISLESLLTIVYKRVINNILQRRRVTLNYLN